MELKEFVTGAILDIIEGVREAQEKNTTDAIINSPTFEDQPGPRKLMDITFDVAISAAEITEKGRGLGVSAARTVYGVFKRERKTEESSVSRVQFTIPVRFPSSKKK